ncbi:MAG: glycosyltransferase [Bacteroidales bacterium]|nr:glycosyltransferase [Bacteroidales bacterium]
MSQQVKRVLFITYYWPPSGKASLHWPLNITRHLPEFGWEPIILTVENESFTDKDENLLKEVRPDMMVIKTRAFEVFNLYRRFIGKKKHDTLSVSETMSTENQGFRHRLSLWIRMNIFVPDARIGWYFNAVRGGRRLIKSLKKITNSARPIQAIISIGTPHSTHLIGKRLSKIFGIPHLPFFSDPWTSISYYKYFKRNSLAEKLDQYYEKSVLENARKTIFVTQNTCNEYIKKYPFLKGRTDVLYWGYNEDAFSGLDQYSTKPKDTEILLHAGNLFDYQNPVNFWQTIRKRIESGKKIMLKFTGTVGLGIIKSIKENNLSDYCEYLGFLPYPQLIKELQAANYLLVCPYDSRHVPGKLFEYLRIGKPIIAFCDDNSEIRDILDETRAGMLFPYDSFGSEFFDRLPEFNPDFSKVKQYDRYNISDDLSKILDNIFSENIL